MLANDFRAACASEVGKPYIWGGSGPNSYDCSGFAQWALAQLGLDPPGDQTADGLFRFFSKPTRGYEVVHEDSALGDLVFFGTDEAVTHVAIGWGDGNMIEAGGGGRRTTTVDEAKKVGAAVRIREINRRKDLVAIVRPFGVPWLTPLVAAAGTTGVGATG